MSKPPFQIAVVDDEPKITKLLKLLLEENFNCAVEVFNDPIQALRRLQEKKFDAISLDHNMPQLFGMDLVKMLRESHEVNFRTRIILLTGYRETAECSQPNLLDEVYFLDKPISDERYLRWISMILLSESPSDTFDEV
jgi:CheY-like chemotaxis protein